MIFAASKMTILHFFVQAQSKRSNACVCSLVVLNHLMWHRPVESHLERLFPICSPPLLLHRPYHFISSSVLFRRCHQRRCSWVHLDKGEFSDADVNLSMSPLLTFWLLVLRALCASFLARGYMHKGSFPFSWSQTDFVVCDSCRFFRTTNLRDVGAFYGLHCKTVGWISLPGSVQRNKRVRTTEQQGKRKTLDKERERH